MSKPKFPITVKRGHTTVKIYRTPSRGCDAYTVSYYLGDQRVRKTFADLGLATTEAETVATKLSTGEVNVLTLTSDDRLGSPFSAGHRLRCITALFVPFSLRPRSWPSRFPHAHGKLAFGSRTLTDKHHKNGCQSHFPKDSAFDF